MRRVALVLILTTVGLLLVPVMGLMLIGVITSQNQASADCAPSTIAASINLGDKNDEIAFNYFVSQPDLDLNKVQASAIVGNFIGESNVNPETVNSIGAFGVAQWLGVRLERLRDHKFQGRPVTDIYRQLDFAREELLGSHRDALNQLKRAGSIEDATIVFENLYEISGDTRSYARRIQGAKDTLTKFGNRPVTQMPNVKVYLLGDSIGLGAKAQLEANFQAVEIPININASVGRSILRPGITSGNRTSGVETLNADTTMIKKEKINAFVIELGTNGEGSPDTFRTNLQGLIKQIIAINPDIESQIYVVNIFSPGVAQKDAYNTMLKQFGDEAGFTVIDANSKKVEVGPDSIHPTAAGQKVLADLIAEKVTSGTSAAGLSCANNGPSGDSQQRIIQTIMKYALPDYHPWPYLTMDPDYKKAVDTALKNGEWVGGGTFPGVDCGGFVTRVMRDSGVDPNYNKYQSTVVPQQQYMDDHPELYKRLGPRTSTGGQNPLQPGDIAINSVHTYFYVGTQPGFHGDSASASFDLWRTPMASSSYFSNSAGSFIWYRYIGQPGGKPNK